MITLEFNGKFEKIEKLFSTLKSHIETLELRVATMEEKLDDYEQERLLYSLYFIHDLSELGNFCERYTVEKAIIQIFETNLDAGATRRLPKISP